MPDSPPRLPDAALTRPATRRINTPSSQRLMTITEGPQHLAPPIPPKSILRTGSLSLSFPQLFGSSSRLKNERNGSASTSRTPPPAYERNPYPVVVDDAFLDRRGPIEGEKVAELRRQRSIQRQGRGGWWRVILLSAVVFLAVLALAVGLGVGLTAGRRKHRDASHQTGAPAGNSTTEGPFPLGEYSMTTALKQVTTNCTTNAATWACYPYNVFSASNPTQSRAIFNWILTNSSSDYATINTASTPDSGVPANLTISSTDNPLAITFENRPLTYISPSSNLSSARYTFDFAMQKAVIPSTSITSDNSLSQCFFNQTTFTGTLYLSAGRTYPDAGSSNITSGFQQWPYAIEISQTSSGGMDIPACYQYTNGVVGARTTSDLTPQAADAQCSCGYRNF
ncbi:hypothetical protein DOTSEDRAFT_70376 [Dothistroma septosporum NZE10]|uniref:Tat pathway signal sequence n=1 Tax=Dothistroma septosporum (strain NZE10 / CBS 128990) TaxID=675120 RepID=N1PSC6_DOTSN|nr:hypothetical protein DOTSEDRAFT_70376 [Dothistroma septosporum NZE10]